MRNNFNGSNSGGKLAYSSCVPFLNVNAAGNVMTFETSK
jgi:hypothetical protein